MSSARQRFLSGITIAAIPIGIQISIAGLIAADPGAFPNSDKSYEHLPFWFMQIILLCISVCGNTLVDFSMANNKNPINKTKIHGLYFWLSTIMVSVAMSMVDSSINFGWIGLVCACAVATLVLAYSIEIEMALSDTLVRKNKS